MNQMQSNVGKQIFLLKTVLLTVLALLHNGTLMIFVAGTKEFFRHIHFLHFIGQKIPVLCSVVAHFSVLMLPVLILLM